MSCSRWCPLVVLPKIQIWLLLKSKVVKRVLVCMERTSFIWAPMVFLCPSVIMADLSPGDTWPRHINITTHSQWESEKNWGWRESEPEKLLTEKLACDFQWLMALKASPFLALIGLTMIFSLASIYSHIFMWHISLSEYLQLSLFFSVVCQHLIKD